MCFIFWKHTGEIYEASLSARSLEDFFGENAIKAAAIFDFLVLDYNQFQFYNFKEFRVVDGELKLKDKSKLRTLL